MSKKVNVFVGMSGGVDSSVTAALLLEQGYAVTGVYMKNWAEDLPGMRCPWEDDYRDAKRVAVHLGIPFKLYDFQTEYRHKVVDYMLAGYRAGITPNPDIMCNQEIKFKLFLDTALHDGAGMIATGHYARSKGGRLFTAANAEKDQTYFLYRVTGEALRHSLMPIGDIATKTDVRALARQFGLSTAEKKDSQGICFVGKVGIKDFLLHELGEQPHGTIIDDHGRSVGEHEGALFYTIGQRHGLNVGGGLPYYVTGKNMEKNEVYVTRDLQDRQLWDRTLHICSLHWITHAPDSGKTYGFRTRYRAPLIHGKIVLNNDRATIVLDEDVRAVTPGQSVVVYDTEEVMGGGLLY